jgi:hypothetical protein
MHFGLSSSAGGGRAAGGSEDNNRYIQTHHQPTNLRDIGRDKRVNPEAGLLEAGEATALWLVIVVVLFFGVVWLIAIEATSERQCESKCWEERD